MNGSLLHVRTFNCLYCLPRVSCLQTLPAVLTLDFAAPDLLVLARSAVNRICWFSDFSAEDFTTCPEFADLGYALLELLRSENVGTAARGLACVCIKRLCSNPEALIHDIFLREDVVELLVPLLAAEEYGGDETVPAEAAAALYTLALGQDDRRMEVSDALSIATVIRLLQRPQAAPAAAGLLGLAGSYRRRAKEVCEHRGPQLLVDLLSCAKFEQELLLVRVISAISALCTVSGVRKMLLDVNVIPSLVRVLADEATSLAVKQAAASAVGNLCLGDELGPPETIVKTVAPRALVALMQCGEVKPCEKATMAMRNLCSTSVSAMEACAKAGTVEVLVKLLAHPASEVRINACGALANLCHGGYAFGEMISQTDVVAALLSLCSVQQDDNQRAEALGALRNLTGISESVGAAFIDEHRLPMVFRLCSDRDSNVQCEALGMLRNITSTQHGLAALKKLPNVLETMVRVQEDVLHCAKDDIQVLMSRLAEIQTQEAIGSLSPAASPHAGIAP